MYKKKKNTESVYHEDDEHQQKERNILAETKKIIHGDWCRRDFYVNTVHFLVKNRMKYDNCCWKKIKLHVYVHSTAEITQFTESSEARREAHTHQNSGIFP